MKVTEPESVCHWQRVYPGAQKQYTKPWMAVDNKLHLRKSVGLCVKLYLVVTFELPPLE